MGIWSDGRSDSFFHVIFVHEDGDKNVRSVYEGIYLLSDTYVEVAVNYRFNFSSSWKIFNPLRSVWNHRTKVCGCH